VWRCETSKSPSVSAKAFAASAIADPVDVGASAIGSNRFAEIEHETSRRVRRARSIIRAVRPVDIYREAVVPFDSRGKLNHLPNIALGPTTPRQNFPPPAGPARPERAIGDRTPPHALTWQQGIDGRAIAVILIRVGSKLVSAGWGNGCDRLRAA